jgi:hypothetical protein
VCGAATLWKVVSGSESSLRHRPARRKSMHADHPDITPEQARRQLAHADARPLASRRDRRVHAVGTALFGLTGGVFMASQNMASGLADALISAAFLVLLVAEGAWIERAARTVPRRARRWSRVGLAGSLLLALGVVLPWLNLQAQSEPNTWPMVALGGLVVAVPSLLAAAAIVRSRA